MGLVAVVARWLGQRLDKRQQVSDWERRPLLPAQVEYAGKLGMKRGGGGGGGRTDRRTGAWAEGRKGGWAAGRMG